MPKAGPISVDIYCIVIDVTVTSLHHIVNIEMFVLFLTER